MKVTFLLNDIITIQEVKIYQQYLIINKKISKDLLIDMYKDAIEKNVIPVISKKLNISELYILSNLSINIFYSNVGSFFYVSFEDHTKNNIIISYLIKNYKSLTLFERII